VKRVAAALIMLVAAAMIAVNVLGVHAYLCHACGRTWSATSAVPCECGSRDVGRLTPARMYAGIQA
jgi:hypothetical protein